MGTILLVGEDDRLLQSRAMLLARTAVRTLRTTPAGLATTVGSERVDLVILCHSVRPAARSPISSDARQRWPGVRVIQILRAEYDMDCVMDYPDRIVPAAEPRALIRTATELLRPRPQRERAPLSLPAESVSR